ncbi:9c671531-a68b-4c92-8d2d-45aa51630b4b [Thermothielavioides terrestris]|uniref:9c671531-a68b-4c92-8d2d-45aa51630b4b n=1 Tax=Thermothielavioides terrestris TaxID=2587410 RepID=A0A446BP57_9PEZI|nr:9c671531-a68b-4c92-8d2d-45aa51630b4b [Thermothielavioides terrestris]
MVLANSSIVEANAQVNPDPLRAPRAAAQTPVVFALCQLPGSDLGQLSLPTGPTGVVTIFDLSTIPVHAVYGGIRVYSAAEAESFMRALAGWQLRAGVFNVRATVAALNSIGGTAAGLLYSEPAAARGAAFTAIADIPVRQTAMPPTNLSVLAVMQARDAASAESERRDYRSVTTQMDADLYADMFRFWAERAEAVYNRTGANQTLVMQPVTAIAIQITAATPWAYIRRTWPGGGLLSSTVEGRCQR